MKLPILNFWFLLGVSLLIRVPEIKASEPLQKLESCTLTPTDWADGDSFLVRTKTGVELTVRLYGVDCLESSINDDSDARRLRAQRRYFGITRAHDNPKTAIKIAKDFGHQAKTATSQFLTEPFTVHTAYSDARGDGRHKRVYAFVVNQNGDDLAAHLVAEGLARAYGVYRTSYDGLSHDDYRENLRDLELQAAKRGKGIWSLTDWNTLPAERHQQRMEEAETDLALDDPKLEQGQKIDPNTAARDELMRLPGIGETFANRIIEGRPYQNPTDLLRVSGIGPATLEKMSPHLTFATR